MTLGGELLLPRELRLELREPRVFGLDRLALVANLALAFLELRLELGELRVALVESGRTARQALLGLGAGLEHLLLLGEGGLQLVLSRACGGELLAQVFRGAVGDHRERLGVGGSCRQLEPELDVRLKVGGLGRVRLFSPALELCAQAGTELLLLGLAGVSFLGRHLSSPRRSCLG